MRRNVALGAFALALLLAGTAGLQARAALGAARAAERHLRAGAASTMNADSAKAEREYRAAIGNLDSARRVLDGAVLGSLAKIPLLGRPLRSATELAEGGQLVAEAGVLTARWWAKTEPRLRLSGGGLDVDVLREGGADLAPVQALLARAAQTVHRGSPPLTRFTERYRAEVDSAIAALGKAREAMPLMARMLDGRRRYFLAMQTPSELRGTGGLIGAYGVLEVSDGKLRLGRFGRPREDLPSPASLGVEAPEWYTKRYGRFDALDDWRNLNMTPDFPTLARLAAGAAERIPAVGPVDGVVGMDPVALAALLRLTGPIQVDSWPEPIDAVNAVEVVGNQAYARYPGDDPRLNFFGDVTLATWTKLFSAPMRLDQAALTALGDALAGRHLQLNATRPDEQEALRGFDVTGELRPEKAFGLVSQNSSGHKADFFLRRRVTYDIALRPNGDGVTTVTAQLYNGAPVSGQPPYVIGPLGKLKDDPPGTTRGYVSLYAPPGTSILQSSQQGAGTGVESAMELGVPVFSDFVTIAPRSSATWRTVLWTKGLVDRRQPKLDLVFRTQPLLFADVVTVRVTGSGWKLRPPAGAKTIDGGFEWTFRLDRDVRVSTLVLQER